MEFNQISTQDKEDKTEAFKKDSSAKSKTSLRFKYEAESRVIRSKFGSLEEVRKDLGLSRRKMCHLLMVDPSAWSRWVKDEDKIPPHIYRSLQWYLALIDKQPEWHPQNSFGPSLNSYSEKVNQTKINSDLLELKNQIFEKNKLIEDLEGATQRLEFQQKNLLDEIASQTQIKLSWKFIVLLNSAVAIYLIFFN